jgi:hypothetical protein
MSIRCHLPAANDVLWHAHSIKMKVIWSHQQIAEGSEWCALALSFTAWVVELVDTQDLKSCGPKRPYGFDPRPGYDRQSESESESEEISFLDKCTRSHSETHSFNFWFFGTFY